jgi:uncharacterized protein with FMN-binding domain
MKNKISFTKKIIAPALLLSLSFYTAFADRDERGEREDDHENEKEDRKIRSCSSVVRELRRGYTDRNTNGDVSKLQKFLKEELKLSDADFLPTGYFGKLTEKYVREFQKRNSISTTGIIGKISRKKISDKCVSILPPINSGTTTIPTVPTSTSTSATTTTSALYKDGNYSVTTSYNSPGGMDDLGVNITILGDKVTALRVTNGAHDGTSVRYQNNFISSISSYTVGQNIGTLKIGVVSGASLTSRSFNDALNKIRTQAQI